MKIFPFFTFCVTTSFILISSEVRASTEELLFQYIVNSENPSDIYEHLPVLRELASECESVIEIGVRRGVSTWGILLGLSENDKDSRSYIGIDLGYPPDLSVFTKIAHDNNIDFDFWKTNDMEIDIVPCDMLFIDSLHTYCHLTYELETFSSKVGKYITMHDTSAPWGHCDDDTYHGNYSEYPQHYNRSKRGLWPAVEDFLIRHPEWRLKERRLNNHGFTTLERID